MENNKKHCKKKKDHSKETIAIPIVENIISKKDEIE